MYFNVYSKKDSTSQRFILSALILCATLLFAAWSNFYPATASELTSELQWRGLVQSMPASGVVGTWVVSGRSFMSNESTRFDQENGSFAIGVCVDVRYQESGSGAVAERISTKAMIECSAATGTGTTTGTPAATTSATTTTTGTPVAVTTGTATGTTTGTPQATTTATTTGTSAPPATTTGTGTGTPQATTTATTTPQATGTAENCGLSRQPESCKHYGRINTLPQSGLFGTWTVGNIAYAVNEQTRLETDYGAFAAGVCVEVKYRLENNNRVAEEIESEKSYLCGNSTGNNNSNERQEATLYGVLVTFPPTLIGTWEIGGMSFVADGATQFKQQAALFATGLTVKIKFYTAADGSNHAQEIESRFENDSQGSDDDGNGSHDGAEGMVLGVIETIPANRIGVWRIDGIDYTANADTEFEEENGALAVGARLRMRYHLNASNTPTNSQRIADNIKTITIAGQVQPGEDAHLAGFVSEMPAVGFSGRWLVSNVAFETTAATRFQEENGLLALGAYAEVEYRVVNGVNQVVELKTQVPPGAGDINNIGKIEQISSGQVENGVVAASANTTSTWRIAGVDYIITDATLLNSDQAALKVGSTATVNSYRNVNGNQVATKVQGIQLSQRVLLPLARR